MSVGRAALWAAITTWLAILAQTVELADLPSLTTSPAFHWILQISLGFCVPSLAWSVFFWTIYRESTGGVSALSSSTAAWIVLALGVVFPLIYAAIPEALHTISLTRYREAMLLLGLVTSVAWIVFLVLYAINQNDPRIPNIAQGLIILTGLGLANALYGAVFGTRFETWWNYHLIRTGWKLISSAISISRVAGGFVFVSAFWRDRVSA